MPQQPTGEVFDQSRGLPPAPSDPAPLSAYLHIPFCRIRCGYCDFNTYTSEFGPGADHGSFHQSLIEEIRQASRFLKASGYPQRPLKTVFFGGGTPTMLEPRILNQVLQALRDEIGITTDAEITLEANPDTVTEQSLAELKAGGFNRVSFGVQSFVPHVLQTLDRTHRPQAVPEVIAAAKKVGFSTSLDLIYGTPAESVKDWEESLKQGIALEPDHISAYSLIIEPGTKLHARMERGELPWPEDDDQGEKYEVADRLLAEAGYQWYEISNWARKSGENLPDGYPRHASRHNLAYWQNHDWWGFGPGAHSHINGQRWWNVKHPLAYAQNLQTGKLPVAGTEILSVADRSLENLMLMIRTLEGYPRELLISGTESAQKIADLIRDGLIDAPSALKGQLKLTLSGRLLADYVVRTLSDELNVSE
ncbi:coproporphyrinogen III oxidase [Boudabousia liubingyangii]|uniref:Heme chaperone HemW n=1 Tax=Boudabousia liubingyangii TaxID=1921764 RepID=A0A1Q5PMZ6_9ACTO|nr:radical SAM family heme chaperone HemW [Boudabousia liubingyangii]OKL48889.1 coproporphyrinogen III oxidase [Boudabousia liubingyangii]